MKLSEIINNEKYNDNTRIRRPNHFVRSYPLYWIKKLIEWNNEKELICSNELKADDWEIADDK